MLLQEKTNMLKFISLFGPPDVVTKAIMLSWVQLTTAQPRRNI